VRKITRAWITTDLIGAGCVVAVEVEAALAARDAQGVSQQSLEGLEVEPGFRAAATEPAASMVRVHASGEHEARAAASIATSTYASGNLLLLLPLLLVEVAEALRGEALGDRRAGDD